MISKEELKKLYFEEKKGTWAIAQQFGVNQNAVRYWFNKYNIPLRSHKEANEITQNTSFVEGEEHPNWAGDNVGYSAIHGWVRSRFGTPQKCSKCGITDGNFEWANISGKYKREVNDWIRLCRSCHRKMDYQKMKTTVYCDLCGKEMSVFLPKIKYKLCKKCRKKCWDDGTLNQHIIGNN